MPINEQLIMEDISAEESIISKFGTRASSVKTYEVSLLFDSAAFRSLI